MKSGSEPILLSPRYAARAGDRLSLPHLIFMLERRFSDGNRDHKDWVLCSLP